MRRVAGMKYLSGRLGVEEDIANATAFFASRSTSMVTGQTMHVSGGVILP